MSEENDILIGSKDEAIQPQAKQVGVRMQQGEHTGQPIYSNFTSVRGGQGVVIVDFGFLDPQTINTLNRLARSGEKAPDTVGARMSCRMAISIDAANQLSQQLNQLMKAKADSHGQAGQSDKAASTMAESSSTDSSDKESTPKSDQGGFRFPWSKTHCSSMQ